VETQPLELKDEQFPLPCSVERWVMERYAVPCTPGDPDLVMDAQELLHYLRNVNCDNFRPIEEVLGQTEAIGDPAVPTGAQIAILNWVVAALADWQQHFALEEPLAAELRRLNPLVAAMAVTETRFLTPGEHPLHQLLDTIHLYAIGWQPRLGRVGQALKDQVCAVVDAALARFDSPAVDLAAIAAEMAARAARARAQASRVAQRLSEAEHGRIRVAQSKRQAALMINSALERYPAPAAIGELLKGAWYDSAQLVLLKFGVDSAEWEDISGATTRLLDSLQNSAATQEEAPGRRQYIFESISLLSKDLGRCLISLQHDVEALREAAALIEFFHTKVLRKQALELEAISPLALESEEIAGQSPPEALDTVREGQWFVLDTDNSLSLRAALALRMDEQQQLLFIDQAGMKVFKASFAEFARMMDEGKVALLDAGASFSRCLARSAGVTTQDDLDELTGVAAEKARVKEQQRQQAERERRRLEQEQAEREWAERERQLREQEKNERLQRELEQAERLRQEREKAECLRREQARRERQLLEAERAQAQILQEKWADAALRQREQADPRHRHRGSGHTRDLDRAPGEGGLKLARSTWLGFHEGDKSTLARVAVFNRQHNAYIFVDCYGRKIRQLGERELVILITSGMADVLESRSGFRDEVARAQQPNGDWHPASYKLDSQAKGHLRVPEPVGQQPRYPVEATVFIQLVAPEFGSNQPGVIARCKTMDIGSSGLRVGLDHDVLLGAIVEMAVELPAAAGTLYLVGEVRRCRPIPGTGAGPNWWADFALLNSGDADFECWQALIGALES
jgi:hypothetical protein